ncbi:MAG: beta-ketoacyl synthase chain length factor, partial [Gammaproteobacteria bacterium]|nr:beta-ketoacyl synthase chain length factor [Gammaproteobacteria bacterium]
MKLGIAAIGMVGPGITGWETGREILSQDNSFDIQAELPPLKPELLPANERRRTTPLIKLALQAAQDALGQWEGDSTELGTVFASASGDVDIVDKIITSLLMPGSPVSPTHFHNSVHNAPAGYWSIATHSHAPSTSISAYDATFAAGLVEAATSVVIEQRPVMLVAYDMLLPPRMHPFRPLKAPFA